MRRCAKCVVGACTGVVLSVLAGGCGSGTTPATSASTATPVADRTFYMVHTADGTDSFEALIKFTRNGDRVTGSLEFVDVSGTPPDTVHKLVKEPFDGIPNHDGILLYTGADGFPRALAIETENRRACYGPPNAECTEFVATTLAAYALLASGLDSVPTSPTPFPTR